MTERIIPDVVAKRPPTAEQHAKELYGLPSNWEVCKWEVKGDKVTGYLELTGGVYLQKFARGPRKGHTNYSKPEPGSVCVVSIPFRLEAAWRSKWEEETGCCAVCEGTGQSLHGWSAITGSHYRTCAKCNGAGAPSLATEAETA